MHLAAEVPSVPVLLDEAVEDGIGLAGVKSLLDQPVTKLFCERELKIYSTQIRRKSLIFMHLIENGWGHSRRR